MRALLAVGAVTLVSAIGCDAAGVRERTEAASAAATQIESRAWVQLPQPAPVPVDSFVGGAFDRGRNVVVAVTEGFFELPTPLETWEYNGTTWTRTWQGASGALGRGNLGFYYDEARRVTVAFGGCTAYQSGFSSLICHDTSNETWEYSGTTWTRRAVSMPPVRGDFALAYDAVRNRGTLFGGVRCVERDPAQPGWGETCTYSGDTWAYAGGNWTAVTQTGPSPRRGAAMAFDRVSGRLILYGGSHAQQYTTTELTDTWEFDGTRWTALSPTRRPASSRAKLVTGQNGRVLAFDSAGGVWRFGGTDWEPQPSGWPAHAASARTGSSSCLFDATRGESVCLMLGWHWKWDGNGWKDQHPSGFPPATNAWLVTDPVRRRVVLIGYTGADDTVPLTWEWDGQKWLNLQTSAGPSHRVLAAAVFDAALERVLLVGHGANTADDETETWAWSGSAWQLIQPVEPLPRFSTFALASDVRRKRVVLVGQRNYSSPVETFEWDGSRWRDFPLLLERPDYGWEQAGYDAASGETVFGSFRWNGSAFRKAAGYPPGAMAFVDSIGTLVAVSDRDTWHWSGTEWLAARAATFPTTHENIAYDPVRGRLIAVGAGQGFYSYQRRSGPVEVWEYNVLGASCGDSTQAFTTHCVDGVTCDVAACSACQTCAGPNPGRCSPVIGAPDPDSCDGICRSDGSCGRGAGQACSTAAECASTHCVDGVCCSAASCDTCQSCATAAAPGTCAAVTHQVDSDSCSGALICDAIGRCLLAPGESCLDGEQCASGQCVQHRCCEPGKCRRGLGEACGTGGDCDSNHCVDGVCCNSPCNGSCEACGSDGSCVPVPENTLPIGDRAPCASDGSFCGGRCDGVRRSCAYPGRETSCGRKCTGNGAFESVCNAAGQCAALAPRTCAGNLMCDEASDTCLERCAGDVQCTPGHACNTGECVPVDTTCQDDVTVRLADGTTQSCFPYRCQTVRCTSACTGSRECAAGATCVGTTCIGQEVTRGTVTADLDKGCGCRTAEGRASGRWLALAGVFLALVGLRRAGSRRNAEQS